MPRAAAMLNLGREAVVRGVGGLDVRDATASVIESRLAAIDAQGAAG